MFGVAPTLACLGVADRHLCNGVAAQILQHLHSVHGAIALCFMYSALKVQSHVLQVVDLKLTHVLLSFAGKHRGVGYNHGPSDSCWTL